MTCRVATWGWFLLGASSVATAWVACNSSYTTSDAPTEPDSGGAGVVTTQDAAPVMNANFSLAVATPSLVADPGGAIVPLKVTIDRKNGFDEGVNITLANAPSGVAASATIQGGESSATLNVSAAMSATVGQTALASVVATSTRTGAVATQPLFVRVGHTLLLAADSVMWTVPPDCTNATFSAWGAGGGGAGAALAYPEPGGPGGAGGFTQATFKVTPGATLQIQVGKGGGLGTDGGQKGRGGGGGGWSAVLAADGTLLLAAGGGGGGGGAYGQNSSNFETGHAGGNGSGLAGTAGGGLIFFGTGGAGGTETCDAGAYNGGGSAGMSNGGAPNGGGTTISPGGGGGGFCGGGQGSGVNGSGGGGGSGFATSSASGMPPEVRQTGTGVTPPQMMSPYYAPGVGVGGDGSVPSGATKPATAGGPGRVAISLLP